jgi:YHS domain-containing protein
VRVSRTNSLASIAKRFGVGLPVAERVDALGLLPREADGSLGAGARSLKGVREPVAVTSLSGQLSAAAGRLTDPVCGMSVDSDDIIRTWSGHSWAFCSARCADAFEADPHRYVAGSKGQQL